MKNIKINKKLIYKKLSLLTIIILITINSKCIFAQENLTTEINTETTENIREITTSNLMTETTTLGAEITEKSTETTTDECTKDENVNIKNKVDELEIKVNNIEQKLDELINSYKNNKSKKSKTKVPKKTISKSDEDKIKKSTYVQPKQVTEIKTETTTQEIEDKKEIRYPNKLTPKQNNLNSEHINTNIGIPTKPTKARATVTENKNNANKDYPIYHSNEVVNNKYLADARQFITFQTKNGKIFYLIINHDEESENVLLLTEASEDDLLNMVEIKDKPIVEPIQQEQPKEEIKPEKVEEKSNLGLYILIFIIIGGVLAIGYYFKAMKNKENEELSQFEEDDDSFISESEIENEEK